MGALNTATQMPQDIDSRAIQTLAPVEASVAQINLSASSQPTALPAGSQIVEVAATGNCRFTFGTSAVVVSGSNRLLPAGAYIYRVPFTSGTTYATHFDAITVDGSTGRVSVTVMN